MKTQFMLLFVALAFNLSVQAAAPTCGLTIITHGYMPQDSTGMGAIPAWMIAMEDAMRARIGSDLPTYLVRFQKSGSQPTSHRIFSNGTISADPATPIDITEQGGAIILLDWFDASDETQNIPTQNVADQFFDFLFGRGHNGHNLGEVPIHLIGHSRGASLNARLAYRLAQSGILVEQVTSIDPHPVTFLFANDWPVTTYINTVFADNYYRTLNTSISNPTGNPVPGAANVNLNGVLTGGDEHSKTHAYYHGTIDLQATSADGEPIIAAWYQQTAARDETGFNFSRFTNLQLPRPLSGVNQSLAGAGGTGSRDSVDTAFQFWPNVGFDQRGSYPERVTVGQTVNIPYYSADRSSQQTITFFTDSDTNPFNGEQATIGSGTQNSRPGGDIGSTTFPWTPAAADVGTHYIRAKTTNTRTDLTRVRYDYYFKTITVQAAPTPTPTITSVSPATLPPSSSPQLITIYGSNFLPSGNANASKLIFYDPANNPTPLRTPSYVNSGRLDYNATLPVIGNWKVKVVNGSAESLRFSFTVVSSGVQLTGLSISGPASVNQNSSSGQYSAKAVFTDGSTPTVTPTWSVNVGAPASISTSGQLTAGSVSANTPVTITASYTTGGITRTASYNVIIVKTGNGGDANTGVDCERRLQRKRWMADGRSAYRKIRSHRNRQLLP